MYLMKYVYPETKVSVVNHKDLLDNESLKDFKFDVKRFNNQFANKRKDIIHNKGNNIYREYLRYLFKIYIIAQNQDFITFIKAERIAQMKGKKNMIYSYKDMIYFTLANYNNILILKMQYTLQDRKEGDKLLAFISKVTQEISSWKKWDDNNKENLATGGWKFQNDKNLKKMFRNSRVWYWCQ